MRSASCLSLPFYTDYNPRPSPGSEKQIGRPIWFSFFQTRSYNMSFGLRIVCVMCFSHRLVLGLFYLNGKKIAKFKDSRLLFWILQIFKHFRCLLFSSCDSKIVNCFGFESYRCFYYFPPLIFNYWILCFLITCHYVQKYQN